ncbi:MAG TPA: HRDC domain-containing protein [Polyangiaceae bacterium]
MQLIDTAGALEQAAGELAACRTFHLDTEFESSRKGQRLSLLQLNDGKRTILFDVLRLERLDPLRRVLSHPECEWVLHAGIQDVDLLKRSMNLDLPRRVFDTQVGWAFVGPEYSVSLSYLVYRVLGIRTGKPHQADDWMRRPLGASELEYAAQDVEHLPALKRAIEQLASELGRGDSVHEVCRELLEPRLATEARDSLRLDSFRNAWQLDAKSQAALVALIDWYNGLDSAGRERAPEPKTLLAIASRLPQNAAELARLKGVSQSFAERNGEALAARLRRAAGSASGSHQPIEPSPYATFQQILSEGWLQAARAEVCAELRIAPELALPNRLLSRIGDELCRGAALSEALGVLSGWRGRLLGEPIRRYSALHGLPRSPGGAMK